MRDKLQNDIDTINEYAQTSKSDMAEAIDTDVLAYMAKNAHDSNVFGTAYATGTVTVTTGTGAVVGSGTTFTAGMVGGYFKATGQTTSYIVATFTDTTNITIIDKDGVAYTGGAVSGGTAYSIAAALPTQATKSTIYSKIVELRTALGKQKTPKDGRFLIVNADLEGVLLQAPEFIPAVGVAYEDAVKGAKIGKIAGFDVYSSELVPGSNTSTTGYWYIAGTRDYCAMALQIMKVNVIDSANSENTFTTTCKGLLVWGKKVFAGNRGRGAVSRIYF